MTSKLHITASTLMLVLTTSLGLLSCPNQTLAAPNHLVINQVQVTGGAGHSTDDFIELFNPTNTPVDLKGYRLVKRTASGTTDTTIKSWTTTATVPAYGFYLWANSNYKTQTADASTSQTIASDNGIALRHGAENTGIIIDSLAWGKANNGLVEATPYPTNPAAGMSLQRKPMGVNSVQDTNNNAEDFEINSSAPQSSGAGTTPPAPTQSAPNNTTHTSTTPNTTTTLKLPKGYERRTGTVAAAPGTFSRTTLFLSDPPLQVVLAYGTMPQLSLGDQLAVSGTLSHTTNGTKLTVKKPTDLVVTGHGEPPEPTVLTLAQVTDEHEAELIKVSGQVKQTSATTFSLIDGTTTIHFTLKNRDLAWPKVYLGQQVTAAGIVALSSTGVRIWPRSPDDIVANTTQPVQQTIDLTETPSKNQYPGYLFLGLVVLVLGGAYVWEKYKLPSPFQLIKKHFTK